MGFGTIPTGSGCAETCYRPVGRYLWVAPGASNRADVERTYDRIVRKANVAEDDFTSVKDLGKPLRKPSFARQ